MILKLVLFFLVLGNSQAAAACVYINKQTPEQNPLVSVSQPNITYFVLDWKSLS